MRMSDESVSVSKLTAWNIELEVRRFEPWALSHQMQFAELAHMAGVAHLIKSVYYDSVPQMHYIRLHGGDLWLRVEENLHEIARLTLHQFVFIEVDEAGHEVFSGVGHGRGIENEDKIHCPNGWFVAAWKAALTLHRIEYEDYGELLRLPQVRMWAVLQETSLTDSELDRLQALANRSRTRVLILNDFPDDLGYWALFPKSETDEASLPVEHNGRFYRVMDYWPFTDRYHLTESRFYACDGQGTTLFPEPLRCFSDPDPV